MRNPHLLVDDDIWFLRDCLHCFLLLLHVLVVLDDLVGLSLHLDSLHGLGEGSRRDGLFFLGNLLIPLLLRRATSFPSPLLVIREHLLLVRDRSVGDVDR